MTSVLIGTKKGLFRLGDDEKLTALGFLGAPVTSVLRDPRDGAVYAGLDHGHFGVKLHRSDDGGETWKEIQAPEYPPKPEDEVDINPMTQEPLEWTTKLLWALEAGHTDDPGALWCGTIPGGLFRSEDRGESWSLVRSFWDRPERKEAFGGGYDSPGMHSICIDPRGGGRMIVGSSCGGAWFTDDACTTWGPGMGMRNTYTPPEEAFNPAVQDAHRIVQCPSSPDVMWTQHHCGIFRSTDCGRTWTELSDAAVPTSFGFAVAVHPGDPEMAWFVPAEGDEVRIPVDARMVVSRTRDGGTSFEQLTDGLPQEHAYDLVYRHGLDVSPDGEHLVLGSTTGSLWVGDDVAGARPTFRQISSSLPPILCLRYE